MSDLNDNPRTFPSPSSEPLQFEVELSDIAEPDASMVSGMLAVHGQQITERNAGDGSVRMLCSARALQILLELQEDGALLCNMVYRKNSAYVNARFQKLRPELPRRL